MVKNGAVKTLVGRVGYGILGARGDGVMRGSDKPTSFGSDKVDSVDLGTSGRLRDRIASWFEEREEKKVPPTYAGLCLELGISLHVLKVLAGIEEDPSVMASAKPEYRSQISEVIGEAVLMMQDYAERQMYSSTGWKGGERIASTMGGVLEPPKKVANKVSVTMPEGSDDWGG